MSFSRQKKRRYKSAVKRSKRDHAAETQQRWFLTLVTRKATVCAVCGLKLVKGGEMVYRHEPVEVRCVHRGRARARLEGVPAGAAVGVYAPTAAADGARAI